VNRRATRLGVLATSLSLALMVSGCGRDDDETSAAPGVTDEPCPDAVDEDKGCISLGVISDLSSAFKGIGVPLTAGQAAFWTHVNEAGGVGDYEVDVSTYSKDNAYDTTKHAQAFAEIKDDVLALAQSLGTAQTEGILRDAEAEDILIIPASLGSNWIFEDNVFEIGNNYCGDAMNSVDYAVAELGAESVGSVYFPTDYGLDASVGAKIAAEAHDLPYTDVPTAPGDNQTAAVAALKKANPDVVIVATGPVELGAILGGLLREGYKGKFIGAVPTWNRALIADPQNAAALGSAYLQSTSFPVWESDTPGHEAMRAATDEPNDWFALGWTSQYVIKAVLEAAIDNDDLTREGVLDAAQSLTEVDSEGTLPEGSGNYAGDPNEAVVRETALNRVDPATGSGLAVEVEPFTGPTLEAHEFEEACYLQ
jgi:ABC-type branched-subunit amino acid transport system substrate-binding protein